MEVILKAFDKETNHVWFETDNSPDQQLPNPFQPGEFDAFSLSIRDALGATECLPLFYFDEDGDKIFVGSEEELNEAFCHLEVRSQKGKEEEAQKAREEAERAQKTAKLEKFRQNKKENLGKKNQQLGGRITMLEGKIAALEARKAIVEKEKESTSEQLNFFETADEEEIEAAFEVHQQQQQQGKKNAADARKQQQRQKQQRQRQRQLNQLQIQTKKIQQQLNNLANKPSNPKVEEKKANLTKRLENVKERQARLRGEGGEGSGHEE